MARKKKSSTKIDMNIFPPAGMKKLKAEQKSLRTGAHWRMVMKKQSKQYGGGMKR